MDLKNSTHVAFADESNWNVGRYRSIALVTCKIENLDLLSNELNQLREKKQKSEFKWHGINKEHGLLLTDFFFSNFDKMRVDVLVWDMEDPRHKGILGRDNIADFARMYYHLLHNVLKLKWEDNSRWIICPDNNKEVDWGVMEECLQKKNWAIEHDIFSYNVELGSLREFYNIVDICPGCSKENPLIQIADFFAGLGAYSYTAFDKYLSWLTSVKEQLTIFDIDSDYKEKTNISGKDEHKLYILHHLNKESKKRKMSIALESTGGLFTYIQKNTLNFWRYEPQSDKDKAPTK